MVYGLFRVFVMYGIDPKTISFDDLKDVYDSRNWVCRSGRRGRAFIYRNDNLHDLNCKQYTCKSCRPGLKKDLHDRVCQQIDANELGYHMVVTFPGSDYRNKISYYHSYRIMNRDWAKLRKVINYHYPGFKYIIFPRAQCNPKPGNPEGYCHFHVIHNKRIDKDWLDEKCSRYTLGYTFLRFNEDVAGYLHNDFYNDGEWVIPFNVKHYRSSETIKLNPGQGYKSNTCNDVFNISLKENTYFGPDASLEFIEEYLIDNYGRCLPFDQYVKKFRQVYMQLAD